MEERHYDEAEVARFPHQLSLLGVGVRDLVRELCSMLHVSDESIAKVTITGTAVTVDWYDFEATKERRPSELSLPLALVSYKRTWTLHDPVFPDDPDDPNITRIIHWGGTDG